MGGEEAWAELYVIVESTAVHQDLSRVSSSRTTKLPMVLTPGNFYESGDYQNRGEKQKYIHCDEIPRDNVLEKVQIRSSP